jgi:hypothetical protein
MPLGASHTATVLNDDDAYDVTAFVLSKPRPLKTHLEADFPARWNKPIDAAFPPYMLGATADQHRYGPFPPLAEKQREMADKRKADMAAGKARAVADPASAATGRKRRVRTIAVHGDSAPMSGAASRAWCSSGGWHAPRMRYGTISWPCFSFIACCTSMSLRKPNPSRSISHDITLAARYTS